jgi:hypothetical protein
MRLDEAKLEELRRWGWALREAGSEESVAAGRAILMLIEELEGLQLELSRAREHLARSDAASNGEVDVGMDDPVASALHERLEQTLARDSDQSGPSVESGGGTTSARSWIETLRRQR